MVFLYSGSTRSNIELVNSTYKSTSMAANERLTSSMIVQRVAELETEGGVEATVQDGRRRRDDHNLPGNASPTRPTQHRRRSLSHSSRFGSGRQPSGSEREWWVSSSRWELSPCRRWRRGAEESRIVG